MLSQLAIALTVSLKTGPWTLLASRHKRIIRTAALQCSKRSFRAATDGVVAMLSQCKTDGNSLQRSQGGLTISPKLPIVINSQ